MLVIEIKVFDEDGNCIVEPFNVPENLNLASFLPISLNREKQALEKAQYEVQSIIGVSGQKLAKAGYFCLAKRKTQDGKNIWMEF